MNKDQLQEGEGFSLLTFKNLILLLLGFVLGCLIKVQATQTITMGYDDYKINEQIPANKKEDKGVLMKKNIQQKQLFNNKNNSQ